MLGHIRNDGWMVCEPVGLLARHSQMRPPGRRRLVHLVDDPHQVCRFRLAFPARDEREIPLRRTNAEAAAVPAGAGTEETPRPTFRESPVTD